MTARRLLAFAALGLAGSCAIPELRVDPDLDQHAGQTGDDEGGGTSGASSGQGGTSGTSSGGRLQGGATTGGTDTGGKGGSDTGGRGGSSSGGSDRGGQGGSATGGKGGSATGGASGSSTGGRGGSATGGGGTGGAAGCTGGLTLCNGTCVNTQTDEAHCGTCPTLCEPSETCENGTCVCQVHIGPTNYLLIDDLEDNDGVVGNERSPALRVGFWYSFNDGAMTCSEYPAADMSGATPFLPNCGNADCSTLVTPPNGSVAAAHMAGNGCVTWGAGMGFAFNSCNGRDFAYDGSAYSGVRFWYKSATPFRLLIGTMVNVPVSMGGTCSDPVDMCYNHHGVDLPSSTGTTVTVPFSTLMQAYGPMRAFDKSQLAGMQFQVNQMAQPYDLWIDDLAFVL